MTKANDVDTLRQRFPLIYSRDGGQRITLGEIVARIGKALDANASEESVNEIASDVINRDFLFGAWGEKWVLTDRDLLRDIRGLIIVAYRLGKAHRMER